jgi:hypothetical protein
VGIFALLIAVVLAVRSRQKVDLSDLVVAPDPDASDVVTDGGGTDTPTITVDDTDEPDAEDPNADTGADTTDPGAVEDETEVNK